MSDNKKPVQLEYWTDVDRRVDSYFVRFRWTLFENEERPTWIDFETHRIACRQILRSELGFGPPEFMITDEFCDGTTQNADEATPTVHGFVKWDGCTQIYFPSDAPTIHADGQEDLASLFDCLLKVRINALEQMGRLEYL